ncbi:MAG: hypothetical protein GY749_16990 [Desulfobacteraceae bacterium]|nr:hypothetical protein [Desulfobacteraceae bacterium]
MKRGIIIILFLAVLFYWNPTAHAKKLALVIGNNTYTDAPLYMKEKITEAFFQNIWWM